jgi:hypothetical protein
MSKVKLYLLNLLLMLVFISCKSGPKVTGCVVDATNNSFQCYHAGDKEGFYVSLYDGRKLRCTSPEQMEDFLKSCKKGKIIEVLLCSYDPDKGAFGCANSGGGIPVYIGLPEVDNYFCLSDKDLKRVKERCKPS